MDTTSNTNTQTPAPGPGGDTTPSFTDPMSNGGDTTTTDPTTTDPTTTTPTENMPSATDPTTTDPSTMDPSTTPAPTTATYTGACLSTLQDYPLDGYVFDFEDAALGATATDMTNWNFFNDGTAGASGVFEVVADAAAGTGQALHITGDGYTAWGQGANTPLGCSDVSAFTGVSFWAKASAADSVVFKVEIPEQGAASDNPDEGDCVPNEAEMVYCYDHPATTVSLTTAWTRYDIPFDSLMQAGTPDPWTGVIVALQWALEGATTGSSHDIWIDEVAFYSGTPPEGRVREPEAAQ